MMMMTFITRGGKGLDDKNKDGEATRSKGMGLETSASRALMLSAAWAGQARLQSVKSWLFWSTVVNAIMQENDLSNQI